MDLIEFLKIIILAIVQGITEPLPISSSGHLYIVGNILKTELFNDINFSIFLNTASLFAICFYYRSDIKKVIYDFFMLIKTRKKEYKDGFKYGLWIIVATIPAGIVGILLKDKVESMITSIRYIGIFLLVTAFFLYLIKDIRGKKSDKEITLIDALIIGLFQALAIIPGISRSGSTIVGAMLQDFKRETALKFSFFLYIPISIASLAISIKDFTQTIALGNLVPYMISFIICVFITYFALKWFINLVKNGKMIYFAIYALIVGILVILFL